MSTETTAPAEHKHGFPCNPPRGSFLNPGPCECGKTYSQDMADRQLAEALEGVEIAYGVPPRVRDEWAVAWGSANLNDGTGYVEIRDDEAEAREHRDLYAPDSSVVRRTVIALAWEIVPAAEATS